MFFWGLYSIIIDLALAKQMKNLIVSISILIMSLSLSAHGEVAYTILKGFDKIKLLLSLPLSNNC